MGKKLEKKDDLYVDLHIITGSSLVFFSFTFMVTQIINPFGLLASILYTWAACRYLGSTENGLKHILSFTRQTLLVMKHQLLKFTDEGSLVRLGMEVAFAYLIYKSYEGFGFKELPWNAISVSVTPEDPNTPFMKRAITAVTNELPQIIKRSRYNGKAILKEISRVGMTQLLKETNKQCSGWYESNVLQTFASLCKLWMDATKGALTLSQSKSNRQFAVNRYGDWRRIPRQLQMVLLHASDISYSPSNAIGFMIPTINCFEIFMRSVLTAIIAANAVAYRIGVHPRQLAWLRNVIAVRLLQRSPKTRAVEAKMQ